MFVVCFVIFVSCFLPEPNPTCALPLLFSISRYWGLESYATNGFNMFAIAKSFCQKITLYGFYPYQRDPATGRHIQHHYFEEDLTFQYQTAEHDFIDEFNKLNNLHEKGEITLVTGKCT